MNKFSIILPVKNGGQYARDCIKSVLAQSYRDFNLLVLDNSSSDDLPGWIAGIGDERIIVYPSDAQLTIEQNWARIRDIERNEFMTMIGHDDLLLPDYLAAMNDLIKEHPEASLYQLHFNYIDSKGSVLRKCQPMPERITAAEFLERQIDHAIDSTGTGYMMRSHDYDSVGGISSAFPNLIFADYKLWVELTAKGYLAVGEKFSFCYRIHNSVSKLTNGEAYVAAFGQYVNFLARLSSANAAIGKVIAEKGHKFLMHYCMSLSHRLLKTPVSKRLLTVADFIQTCRQYAGILIPGQSFEPDRKFMINIAEKLDRSSAGRFIFGCYQSVRRRG